MKLLTAICGALLLALPAWAGELKGERKVAPFKLIKLESDVKPSVKDGKVTTRYSWKVTATSAAGKLIEVDKYTSDGVFIAVAPPGSTVKVDLTVVDFDARVFDEASAVVEVEGKPEPPPDPVPPPPEPFVKRLQDAYSLDGGAGKAASLAKLADLYAAAARADVTFAKTAGELSAWLKKAAANLGLTAGELPRLRKAIEAELSEVLPASADARLTQDHHAAAVRIFGLLAKSLGAIK